MTIYPAYSHSQLNIGHINNKKKRQEMYILMQICSDPHTMKFLQTAFLNPLEWSHI